MPDSNESRNRMRVTRSGGSSTRRSPTAGRRTLIAFALAGAGVGALVVLVLGSLLSENEPAPPAPPAPRVSRVPPPVAKPAAPPAPAPAAPSAEEKEKEQERRRAEEARKKAEAERRRKEQEAAEAKRRADEERTRRAAAKRAYARRKAERREASVRSVADARQRLKDGRTAEAARQEALRRKLKGQKISIRLKNGMTLENVVVQGMTADEVRLAFTFEGALAEQSLPAGFLDDASILKLLRAVHRDEGAAGAYEMGRYLVLRKLWKEAKAAFDRCVTLDASYADRVPDLTRILNDEAAFNGSARRVGDDRLFISYDFADPAMAGDFIVRQPGALSVADGALQLQTKGTSIWSLKDVAFAGELEVDATVTIGDKASLLVGAFFKSDKTGYLAMLNSRRPVGHVLYRSEGGSKLRPLRVHRDSTIPAGTETRVRCVIRNGSIQLYAGDREILTSSDATYRGGWFTLGVVSGTASISKLTVQGRVAPAEIDKRFAEVEVLVRRALEADLGRASERQKADAELSGEDEYFTQALDESFMTEYGKARETLVEALRRRRLRREEVVRFDPLVKRAPEFAPVHYWRGRIALLARRPELARQCFARAVELNPDFYEAHVGLARSALDERDVKSAGVAAAKALDLAPGYGPARALAGFLEYIGGDVKEALAELELSRRLAPADDDVRNLHRTVLNVIKGPQHLGCTFVKEFPHYIVMTDMSPEKTALYGRRLEAVHAHYEKVYGKEFPEKAAREKPRVAIFNTREAYLTYGELTLLGRHEWTLGYYHPLFHELLLFEDVDPKASLHTLYHEAFHEFLGGRVRRVPYWLNEGLAEYAGALRVEAGKKDARVTARGLLLPRRLRTLKAGLARALPFPVIMNQTPGQFYSGLVSFKYAQSWAMVHFFHAFKDGVHRPRLERYLRTLRDGGSPAQAYNAGFGDADMKTIQKEWLDFVKKLEIPK